MKVATFGSCLARFTAVQLGDHFGADHRACVYHVTSEQFYKYFIAKTSPQPPLDYLESFFIPGDRPEDDIYARGMLRNQYPEQMGLWEFTPEQLATRKNFLATIAEDRLDLIILDNFIDLASRCSYFRYVREYQDSPVQFVTHFYKNAAELPNHFRAGEYLTPAASAAYWRAVIDWLAERQPSAKIVFLCFFGCTSTGHPERQWRAAEFYRQLSALNEDRKCLIVPPLEVGPELQEPDDWMHLAKPVYRALAGYVYLHVKANIG